MSAVVAQVCLYGAPPAGFAYLTAPPGLVHAITSKGGWDATDQRPSGELRSISLAIEQAKGSLRALGVDRGDVLVFFPGGEHVARSPLYEYQPLSSMHLEPAPRDVVTAKTIERAARAIAQAKRDPHREEWREGYVEWHRPLPSGERRPVAIFRDALVWVAPEGSERGAWGIARAFSKPTRQVQVGARWFEDGVAPPEGGAKAEHAPFPLLIDALRSPASRGKTLELSAGGARQRVQIEGVSNERGAGAIAFYVLVRGVMERDGARVELMIPTEHDARGGPAHGAELRWSPTRRLGLDARAIRFVPPASPKPPKARRGRKAPSEPAPSAASTATRDEERWDRYGVVWHRPSDTGDSTRVELRHGDLVWASFGMSSARARGRWGRVQGLSPARREVRLGAQWFGLPLIYTYDEAMARGVPPPAEAPGPAAGAPARTPFLELVEQLRSPDARGRTLEVVSTDHTPHTMRVWKVEHDVSALRVSGTIKKTESRLTIWTDTDARGTPKSYAQLQRGSRGYRVDPRRVRFAAARAPAGGAP